MTSFAELDPPTGHLVWLLSVRWRTAVARVLAPFGLTHAQYVLLASLNRLTASGTEPSQRELADFSGLEPMFVSRLARALEDAGLVTRDQHPSDPRAYVLALTQGGRAALTPATAAVSAFQERALEPLGGPDSDRVTRLRTDLLALLAHATDIDEGRPLRARSASDAGGPR